MCAKASPCYACMMEYWTQIANSPSLLIGPVVVGALVSGVIGVWVAWRGRVATSGDVDRKIDAERLLTDTKICHEREEALTDRAWADYGLRRDIYLDLAEQIGCLFESSAPRDPEAVVLAAAARKAFIETTRKVRLVGSDEVVRALNDLTASIRESMSHSVTGDNYSKLMNAIRRDIRTLNVKPPVGTTLDEGAFPIES